MIPYRRFNTIGILGGMGPEATIQLFHYIVKNTPAKKDQDHLPILINNLPQIPDRTQALLYGGENPVPYLVQAGKTLQNAGADFIVIPCNTSHAFYSDLHSKLDIPILHMIEETTQYITNNYPKINKIGLLATTGTVHMKIYQKSLNKANIKVIIPSENVQKNMVMKAIYGNFGIKAGFLTSYAEELLSKAAESLISQGTQAVIMGCTEIPLVLANQRENTLFLNPTEILAKKAVQLAMLPMKPNKYFYSDQKYMTFEDTFEN